ncbi:hypothetical protein AWB78_04028 [Caballeronia calidae]|uniref:Uncharacterized protein n=1 Tax=Caballeronia calidae TaxID=1777139 RepID=A0A158CJG5_9BURK|nr:hypothetical protein AWB78_04028 [Caballeronia calidae]
MKSNRSGRGADHRKQPALAQVQPPAGLGRNEAQRCVPA